jgi:hypothetical protein
LHRLEARRLDGAEGERLSRTVGRSHGWRGGTQEIDKSTGRTLVLISLSGSGQKRAVERESLRDGKERETTTTRNL